MTAILSDIQSNLEHLYEVSVPHNVIDFLITDKCFAEAISNTSINNNVLEQLLVYCNDDYLDVSLYLDNSLVDRLGNKHLYQLKDKNELHDFWVALEGVSHFLYLAWNARYDRPVSQLELELQAEVDKFVSATNAALSKDNLVNMHEIWDLLFSNPDYRDDLNQEELIRYQKANAYASQYCLNLIDMRNKPAKTLKKELRRFYRLRQKEKISRINTLNS
jgi:hypothetical protein